MPPLFLYRGGKSFSLRFFMAGAQLFTIGCGELLGALLATG
jgi:hypothetical protein